jgi:S-disulfanyl-L-cysteine oxidoreductase SoxD
MSSKTGIFWLAALLLVVAAIPAQAQSAAAATTIWDGVYTNAQADRGQRAVQQNCGSCHSPTEWSGNMFIAAWAGRSVADLQANLMMTMPFDAPGKLTPEQYTDIVAYMLKLNDVPTGEAELPSDDDRLKKIEVTRPSS